MPTSACCARASWSIPERSARSVASRMTSTKCAPGLSAAPASPISMTSRLRMFSSVSICRSSFWPKRLPDFCPAPQAGPVLPAFAGMKMPIGLLTLEIYIPEAHSLKDKRQVLRSLKDRLRGKFNVAVAELEGQDSWQRSVVGVVSLANNAGFLEQALRNVLEDSERLLGRDLIGHDLEVL